MPKRPLTDMILAFSHHQMELIRHAGKHRKDVVAQSLEGIREVLENPHEHPFRFHVADYLVLLAYLEEPQALPLLLRLVRLPEDAVESLIGITLPNQLPAFLYKTCGHSVMPLQELVADPSAYLYCRTAAMKALVYAAQDGWANAKDILDFYCTLYTGQEATDDDSCFWDDLTDSVCALSPAPKHLAVVHAAIAKGLTNPHYIDARFRSMLLQA
jgi:hypothetical protein